MRLDLTGAWRDYEPPSLCHTGLEALFALPALGAGAEAATAAAVLGGAGETALLSSAGIATGTAAGLPAAASTGGILGSGIGLSELGTVASAGGTLLEMKSKADQAAYQKAMSEAEAAALKQKANEEAAAGQRVGITRERQAALVASRARALAASSGTDATDPTEVNIEAGIAGQGQYNALSALYEGMAQARSSNYQADIDLFKGQRIGAAAPWAIGGTLLSGLSSFAGRKSRSNYLLSQYGSL